MPRIQSVTILLVVALLVGCSPTVSTDANEYVGEYVFKPSNAAPGQSASFVILKPDHTALEVRFQRETGQVQTAEKKWYLSRTTGQNVVIGDFSHPVESAYPVKLGINDDLGQYYEKVR